MDDIIRKAKQRQLELGRLRDELTEKMKVVEKELRELEGFFAVTEKLTKRAPPSEVAGWRIEGAWPLRTVTEEAARAAAVASIQQHHFRFGEKTRAIAELAAEIIKREGAMTARRILEAMDEQGKGQVLVPGRDPNRRISYLSAILSKDERFRSDKTLGGYVLQEKTPPDEDQAGSEDASLI